MSFSSSNLCNVQASKTRNLTTHILGHCSLNIITVQLIFLQFSPVRRRTRRWGRLIVVSVRVPEYRHGLPEGDPPVVGQTQLHVHLVPDVEVGDVLWVDRQPLEWWHGVAHVDPGLSLAGKGGEQLDHPLRELQIISREGSEETL